MKMRDRLLRVHAAVGSTGAQHRAPLRLILSAVEARSFAFQFESVVRDREMPLRCSQCPKQSRSRSW